MAILESRGRCWSRGELLGTVNRIANALGERGFAKGDVVAVLSPNCIEFVALYLAAMELGMYVIPLNWHLAPAEIAYILENSGASGLVVHERLAPIVRKLAGSSGGPGVRLRVAFGHIDGFTDLRDLIGSQAEQRETPTVGGRVMVYTSATTGRPKAVKLPLQDADHSISRTIEFTNYCGIYAEDSNIHLCASMMYHAGPLETVVIALHMGHGVILMDGWESEQCLQLIEKHKITTTFMVPAMFIRLLKLPPETRARYDVRSLKMVIHSAAPCPPETKRELLEWWGQVIWEGYGAAEGSGTAVGPREWLERPGTVGRPIPGTTLRILDDAGNELPPRQVGTIYYNRYNGGRFEYKDDPEKTAAAYRGELFTVGDIGYVDDDGYLFICDRKVDMVISGGMNVYPAEVEQVLVQHPKVLDCAVFGVPDPTLGEVLRAVVQLAAGVAGDAAVTAELTSFLLRRLSATKIPRKIEYTAALPRDPNGKLFKRLLRDPHWAGSARRI